MNRVKPKLHSQKTWALSFMAAIVISTLLILAFVYFVLAKQWRGVQINWGNL